MKTQFLQIAEGAIAFDDTGNGPLVLCVPGMGDLRSQYRSLASQLAAAGYRVVSMDLRGHGESSTGWNEYSVASLGRDILALLHHLKTTPAVVIGNSIAGGAAVWAAAEGPEFIKTLVLLDPSVRGEIKGAFRFMVNLLFTRPWGPSLWGWYYNSLYTSQKPADLKAHIRAITANLKQPARMEALHSLMLAPQASAAERLERVRVPSLVLMGSRDPDFKQPEQEAAWVAQALNARYEMIPNAGHYPHVEYPEITGGKILAFLGKPEPR